GIVLALPVQRDNGHLRGQDLLGVEQVLLAHFLVGLGGGLGNQVVILLVAPEAVVVAAVGNPQVQEVDGVVVVGRPAAQGHAVVAGLTVGGNLLGLHGVDRDVLNAQVLSPLLLQESGTVAAQGVVGAVDGEVQLIHGAAQFRQSGLQVLLCLFQIAAGGVHLAALLQQGFLEG